MLNYLNTAHKRKSAILTTLIMSVLIFLLFIVGLKYLDPPEEYGIAVNFGTSSVGKGTIQPNKPIQSVPKESTLEELTESVREKSDTEVEEAAVDAIQEKVITQNSEETIAINKEAIAKKKAEVEAKKLQLEKDRIEKERQAAIEKQKAEEAAKRKKLDALIGGINNADGVSSGGEGNDNQAGDKGKITGDPNASGYYGNGGDGNGGDYRLGNRKPLSKPKPNYICNEEGIVVVSIEVDVNGKVIKATPGVKGSTNTAACLLTQAKEAALKTSWQPDAKAPSRQIGTIRYRFSLSQ